MADKTIGELPPVEIGELPVAPDIYDDTNIPVENQGEAQRITGGQWKEYAAAAAQEEAEAAAKSATEAASSAENAKADADRAEKLRESIDLDYDYIDTAREQAQEAAAAASQAEENAGTFAQQAGGSAAAAAGSAEDAAGSVQVIQDNADAIQTVQDNLDGILAAPGAADEAKKDAASAAADALRAEEAAKLAQSIAQGALGYYATPEKLQQAYPQADDGNWVIVGTTDTIWIWDSDSGAWTDSGNKTDLSQYYTKTEMGEILTGVDVQIEAATSRSWEVEVPASGWGPSTETWGDLTAKYEATIEVPDMTEAPEVIKIDFAGGSRAAAGRWTWITCTAGSVTLYSAHDPAPAADFSILVTEVR